MFCSGMFIRRVESKRILPERRRERKPECRHGAHTRCTLSAQMNYRKVVCTTPVASLRPVTQRRPQSHPVPARVRKLAPDVARLQSRCVARRVGIASCAPGFKVANAPAQLAKATAFANAQPSARRTENVPANVSPAPTVSTGRTHRVGTAKHSSAVRQSVDRATGHEPLGNVSS